MSAIQSIISVENMETYIVLLHKLCMHIYLIQYLPALVLEYNSDINVILKDIPNFLQNSNPDLMQGQELETLKTPPCLPEKVNLDLRYNRYCTHLV